MEDQSIQNRVVDSREPESIRNSLISDGWQQRQLSSGDFSFSTHDSKLVGVTRKRTDDLVSSVGDTFSGQLEIMLDLYDICIFIAEGNWSHSINRDGTVGTLMVNRASYQTWDMVWNYLHRWEAKGFILELTTSEQHTVARVKSLFELYQRPYSTSAKTKLLADERLLAFPSGCRGTTGENLLVNLGSLHNIANCSIEELKRMKGVGDGKAKLIYEHFNKE